MPNPFARARTDGELVEAVVASGDERAFRSLYRRHTPRLYMLALRLTGGAEEDSEDIVQETWIRACERMGSFRWESTFSTWLLGVGLNVSRELARKRFRDPVRATGVIPDCPARPRRLAERVDLEGAIARLPDGCREVLVLHDIEGLKHREIAHALGISEGTSKSQLHDARRKLRELLGTQEENRYAEGRADI